MRKIICVLGTRPEAIKMAPIILALKADKNFDVKVCITAQHRAMLDSVLAIFGIIPDYDLNIMTHDQTLTHITTTILTQLAPIYQTYKPDWVLVQGDTTTTFAATLAAFYQKIPVGHLEAGLRSHNIYSPWPEEGNRKLTSMLAQLHFAPTLIAKNNLLKESIAEDTIIITGNTVIDALLLAREKIQNTFELKKLFDEKFSFLHKNKKLVLVTGHRRENFGDGFQAICTALQQLALAKQDSIEIIFPVHLNPNVQGPVYKMLAHLHNIHLVEPQDYLPFIYLLDRCYLVLTDSGGIQEEAPSLGKPVLVMREETERPEGVLAGTAQLVGADAEKIFIAVSNLLENDNLYNTMRQAHNPYGDGTAAQRTLAALLSLHKYEKQ